MKLIFLWGPAAAGKLTVARELARLTGLPVFHNHLVVDALLEKLPFGHPEFIRLRESMWMAGFETAARSGKSMIFTFQPEPTVQQGFAERVIELVREGGGELKFVRLVISRDEQEKRVGNASRKEFKKLVSLDLLRELRDGFEQSEAEMPPADLVIDSEIDDPQTAARRIAAAFNLATASTAS
ncbi:MAG: shikimate kinase [Burkholderiales bacterium]|nr:MAG: shikimate kinase [Burkholderiales bacterium]